MERTADRPFSNWTWTLQGELVRNIQGYFTVNMVLLVALLVGCQSEGTLLLIRSNQPVKETSVKLRENVIVLRRNWEKTKRELEDVHTRRVAEVMAIEADVAYLREALTIDADSGQDPGRLKRVLGLDTGEETPLEELVRAAVERPRPVHEPKAYFEMLRTDARAALDEAAAGNPARADAFSGFFKRVAVIRGVDANSVNEDDLVTWAENYATWARLVALFERFDVQEGRTYTALDLIRELHALAKEVGTQPPPIEGLGSLGSIVQGRLSMRRGQSYVVDKLLSKLIVISKDQEVFLQNDVEAIHWDEVGEAIGRTETLTQEVRSFGEGQ